MMNVTKEVDGVDIDSAPGYSDSNMGVYDQVGSTKLSVMKATDGGHTGTMYIRGNCIATDRTHSCNLRFIRPCRRSRHKLVITMA